MIRFWNRQNINVAEFQNIGFECGTSALSDDSRSSHDTRLLKYKRKSYCLIVKKNCDLLSSGIW